MSELPEFIVVQLEFQHPNERMNDILDELSTSMHNEAGWKKVAVIVVPKSVALYVLFERNPNDHNQEKSQSEKGE